MKYFHALDLKRNNPHSPEVSLFSQGGDQFKYSLSNEKSEKRQ